MCLALAALDDPLQYSHIFPESRPDELAGGIGAKPVYAEYARALGHRAAELEPMTEVVSHVVSDEWNHRHGIASDDPDLSGRCRRGFRTHGRGRVNSGIPVECLRYERNGIGPAAAEDERSYGHALRIFPVRIDRRALRRRNRKAGVGMGRLAAAIGRPLLALPVG